MIRLRKNVVALSYSGKLNYLVILDRNSGKPNVYTVLVPNVNDPVTIGRELPLDVVRDLIARYEKVAPEYWFGDRRSVLRCIRLQKVAR